MKHYKATFAIVAAMCLSLVGTVRAQNLSPLWANYGVADSNRFYNPLAGGNVLPGFVGNTYVNFVNFTGAIDMDDGTADSILTGFAFDYNGHTVNSVNININGWVSLNLADQRANQIPVTPANNNTLYSSVYPNNCLAPYWGDHFYRTTESGYYPSTISYSTTRIKDPNPNQIPGQINYIYTFTVEWRNLNINDKTNPNSIASFQLILRQNPLANDQSVPDQRVYIEYQYGAIGPNNGGGGSAGTADYLGAAVGANDSAGFTHINALFISSTDINDVANNVSARTTCWPPAQCAPGRAIDITPQGRNVMTVWGDGDADLSQVLSPNPQVKNNQSLFVTVNDALTVLQAAANDAPLDSIEGANAFHGDANHNGQVYNTTYGVYFYHTTPYDAAYIMMYLAGKLATLPWPWQLPVPGYKSTDVNGTNISGVVADASNVTMTGSTVLLPITIRGNVNGPLSIQMDLKGLESSGVQFVGARALDGGIVCSNPELGRIALAMSGDFTDGATVGYIELRAPANANAEFDIQNVQVNDMDLAPSHVALKLADAGNSVSNTLEQNVPNPFVVSISNQTTIGFNLATPEMVTLRVFDVLGHEIRTLISGEGRTAGYNTIQWDGRDGNGNYVAAGLYYYQLTTPDFTQCEKMQVIR